MPFLTIQEVATALKVSVSTVRRAVRAGELAVIRVGSLGQIRIRSDALDQYVERASGIPVQAQPGEEAISENDLEPPRKPEPKAAGQMASAYKSAHGTSAAGIEWRVLTGDVNNCLAALEPGSISCAVTSPPYYWQRDYEVEGQIGHEASIEAYVNALVEVFRGVHRSLTDTGTLFLNLGDTYYSAKGRPHGRDDKHNGRQMMRRQLRAVDGPGLGLPRKSLIGIPWRVAIALQDDGWTLRSAVIWQRPGTLPEPTAHDRPWRTYEHVFVFSKGPRYYFNRAGLKGEEDVWRIVARPDNPGAHFAPYPRELVDRCLDVGCKPEGVVLDPFVGSGTTMIAALARGCPAVGIDLKPEYTEFVASRLRREFGGRQPEVERGDG